MAVDPVVSERTRAVEGSLTGPPRVLAILVTHAGRAWIRDALVGLNSQTYPHLDVLVVDDASPDTRVKPPLKRIAKRHLRRVRWGYVRTPRPLGFGGAINWALSRVKTDAQLLLFIHDDAAMEPDALENLVARMMADELSAIVGPKIVDWDDPGRLEEVGMAVDRLGYPYKGLEDHEIDLGQHDQSVEVFYVTTTCMLVKHDVFRELRGWDARMRAFSEDLDLCWRARVAGHSVRVEPAARVRHAIAHARGLRRTPFRPQRYFSRRNRLRAVVKNASAVRLLGVVPLFLLFALVEMVAFIALRQFREIPNIARALGWNLINVPQTLAERTRVQRSRSVPDRRLQRLMVRGTTRVRSYVSNQADRLEEAWGRRAELLAVRVQQARRVVDLMRGRTGFLVAAGVIGFLIAFRHLLWGPSVGIGELLPFPDRATALWRVFASPWRPAGLGEAGAPPPALVLLGIFPLLTLGAAGAAQKLLVLSLGGVAFAGAYRLVAGLVDRPSRIAAGFTYAVGAVGYAGIREGALGALVFGAAAPFVLASIMRLIGWMRPAGWIRGRSVMRVALGAAVSAAFVPGSLVLYVLIAVALFGARIVFEREREPLRGLVSSLVGFVFAWVLLLPWSATWFSQGGVFRILMGAETWRFFAADFAGHGALSVILGQTPDVPALFGLALPLLGAVALLVGEAQRRRAALAFWVVIVLDALLVALMRGGVVRPFVASATEAGVIAAAAFAALAGLAVGAFRLDLPRRGLGLVHAVALSALAGAAFLVVAGTGPAVLAGAWGPGRAAPEFDPVVEAELRDLLAAEAEQEGQFRVLWVGDRWISPTPSVARPHRGHMITGSRGESMVDLFEKTGTSAQSELHNVMASIEGGDTDIGGSLLGSFNVRYVVLDRDAGAYRWLAQRDLALVRSEPGYVLLENLARVHRAAVYPEVPSHLAAVAHRDPTLISGEIPEATERLEQSAASRYISDGDTSGPGDVVLAESFDPRWEASVDDLPLERTDAGWANGFVLPDGPEGKVVVRYPRSIRDVVWLLVIGLAWIVVLGGAFSRRRVPALRSRS
ncbi:MAG: glycosyltransferase [Actinobacteria bacterium]|nr:glycosyltransferase [Actinomycetota bacterium]